MARCTALLINHWRSMHGAWKPMAAYGWCMLQHPESSTLPAAKASSMEWRRHGKATAGKPTGASRGGRFLAATWRDWSRREHREACIQLLRHQRVEVKVQPAEATLTGPPQPLSRAERAQYRLSWEERLARNASALASGQVTIQLIARPRTLCRCSRSGQCVRGHSSCLSFPSDGSVSPSRTS